jgi:type IV secretion system protein VirB4
MGVARDFLVFRNGPHRRKFTVAVTVAEYPASLDLGSLDRLYSVPGEMTISFTVRHIPRSEAEKYAEQMRNYHSGRSFSWKTTVKSAVGDGGTGPTNPGRERMADDSATFLGRLTKGDISGVWLYLCVLCHGDTLEEADATAERVDAIFRACHIRPDREELHLVSAFATSIPGGWKDCARWKFFSSEAFAMIAPVHTVLRGNMENRYLAEQTKQPAPALAVLPTEHATPFYLNTHVHDLGHGFFIGPSRAGKSVAANLFWSQFRRYPDAQVFIFDKDFSSRIPILLQGGTYLDFGREGMAARFNPIASLTRATLEKRMAWIELLLAQRGYSLNAEDSKVLEQSLLSTLDLPQDLRRLSTVFSQIGRQDLKEALEPWIGGRSLARYFDNEVDGFLSAMTAGGSRLMGLEVGPLLAHPQVAAPMMAHAFESIDSMLLAQREQGIVRPTFIYLAEVWHLIQNEQSATKLVDWLKTLAKRCAVVWMDTQSPEDLALSAIWPALRDNVPNRIFLPNRAATSESLLKIYQREFELSQNQIERIAGGTQKRDYFIKHGQISRMVQIRLAPDTLACLRSDMAAQIVFDKHYADGAGAPGWQERYIEEVQGV